MWTPVTLDFLNLTYSALLAAFILIEVRVLRPLLKLLPVFFESAALSIASSLGFTDDLRLIPREEFLDTLVVFELEFCSLLLSSSLGFTDDLGLVVQDGFLDTLLFFTIAVSLGLVVDGTRAALCRNKNRKILPRLSLIRLVKFNY